MNTIEHEYYKKIGSRLKEARKKKDLTQEELADLLNCTSSYISHLENGRDKLTLSTMIRLMEILDIGPNQLLIDVIRVCNSDIVENPSLEEMFKKISTLNEENLRVLNKIVDVFVSEN